MQLLLKALAVRTKGRFSSALWLLALAATFAADTAYGDLEDWPTLGFVQVVTNTFGFPTSITHAADGTQRLFVEEQRGRIWIIQSNAVLAQPFLDLHNRVLSTGVEQGLLGLAFPIGYSTNSHFYVDYTRKPDGATVISRFFLTADPNIADTNSEQVVLVIPQPYNTHNGGQIAFGPDGYLYIGMGDGGSDGDPQHRGQNTGILLGKLLRIDVESGVALYAVPANNPFVGNTNYAPEIWALGLRNPWRFSFDRKSGDLYLGDVGQNRYEEIDFQAAGSRGGQNYGWGIMEGPTNFNVPAGFTNFSALTLPLTWYDHLSLPTDLAASVTGGYVYRGPSEPRMDGVYLFADFMAGWIWGLKQSGTNWQRIELLRTTVFSPAFHISTFGEDDQGQAYLADYYQGQIYKIQDTHQVWTPTFSADSGTIHSNAVVVGCVTPGAVIHYTNNGQDPTELDPGVFSGEFIPVNMGTNKLRALRADLLPSPVISATFILKVATPAFSPAHGQITNGTTVTITTITPGATIYYTTNGSTPGTNSLLYSSPIALNGGTALNAVAVENGYSNSAIQSISYSLAQVATPIFTPSSGPIISGTGVSISCATTGAVTHYTLDGSNPTTDSPIYSVPIVLSLPTTIRAQAFNAGWGPSGVISVFFGLSILENTVVTTFAGGRTAGFSNGLGSTAQFYSPFGICIDHSGNHYVADAGNNAIRKILPSGEVTTFAGTGVSGPLDGPVTIAQFALPSGVCIDTTGNVYVADRGNCYRIRKIDSNGIVSTLTSLQPCYLGFTLWQVELDLAGNIYAGSYGTIVKVLPDGTFSILAGAGTASGQGWSLDFIGVGIDASTNVYAITQFRIWKIDPAGSTELFAGGSDPYFGSGFSDGPRLRSLFQSPMDAAFDSLTNMFVSDYARIRTLRSDGLVRTLAGTGIPGYKNGRGSEAQFNNATGLCVDTNGNVYVADSGNNCIRKISPDTAGIGIADDWQRFHFAHIGIDPNADPDHDGMSNYAEFWAGTDPLDPDSVLVIKSVSTVTNGYTQITWQSVAGKGYTVKYSSDLKTWNTLGSSILGNGSALSFSDSTPVGQAPRRFYRVFVDF